MAATAVAGEGVGLTRSGAGNCAEDGAITKRSLRSEGNGVGDGEVEGREVVGAAGVSTEAAG
eukprot:498425-Pleurochrysis_carterae.AAC.1